VNTTRKGRRVLALVAASAIVFAGCGSDDSSDGADGGTDTSADTGSDTTTAPDDTDATDDTTGTDDTTDDTAGGASGGEFIDLGTFVGDPPEHLDPALNSTLDAYQVINAVYDGLTEIDFSDPSSPAVVPLVADEITPNEDGSVWTFHIREGAQFSDGTEINASTFQDSWERAADLAGDYSYLMTFIDGGAERLAGEADTMTGIEADDATRTLTVTLDAPYSNFDAVAGFQLFFPVPPAAIEAGADWENGIMIGNGPYAMESARTDEEIVLVKSDTWQGDFNGETWPDRLEAIVFRTQADPDTGFNAFEAGEGDNANIPPGRIQDAQENWGTTLDVDILGSYHFVINDRAPQIGGDTNLKLRQAISAAIDRDEINSAVYNDSRTTSTGIVPPGIPGFKADICEYCSYDPEQAQTLFDEWVAEGGTQDGPLPIQFNADAGHEPVVQIIIDNLAAIGIEAEAQPFPSETYFSELADGACVICRAGWFADYPTYDNFMYDLFHSDALDGNNFGFVNEEFDALVDEAKQTVDKDAQAELFNQAEDILLNQATMAIPINWYRGDYAYDQERVTNFPQTNQGLILWEQVTLAE
jgi:ABC-type oligopeptide transport system substrate-binding subunit